MSPSLQHDAYMTSSTDQTTLRLYVENFLNQDVKTANAKLSPVVLLTLIRELELLLFCINQQIIKQCNLQHPRLM